MKIRENVPLSTLTTMRLGGPARYVIEIETEDDIKEAFNFAAKNNLKTFILGEGANALAKDEGFDGAIIMNKMKGIISDEATQGQSLLKGDVADLTFVRAYGGTAWDDVVKYTTDRGLTGIEALSKIPGSAGAAPVQNIGAYGQDVSGALVDASVYDLKTKEFKTLRHFELNFTYRHSILNTTEKGRYFVIYITLELRKGKMQPPFYKSIETYATEHNITDFSPESIREIVSAIRKNKLPDPAEKASSGSFFKNVYLNEADAKKAEENGIPVYHGHDGLKINSGWLIEQAGLKGKLLHGMRVSPTAALVLINESAKSYNDLDQARAEIIKTVKAKFGYELEQEPVEIA